MTKKGNCSFSPFVACIISCSAVLFIYVLFADISWLFQHVTRRTVVSTVAHKCHGTYTKSRLSHANSRHNRANSRHNNHNSRHNRESFNTAEVKCHGGSEKKRQRHSVQNGGIGDDLGDEIIEEDDEEGLIHYYFLTAFER